MLSKVPQWFVALLAGNLQFWLAMRTLAGQSWCRPESGGNLRGRISERVEAI
jgi:hypothetical protein